MVLIDTSAWVEYLRDTGSTTCLAVQKLLQDEAVSCDPVRMEVIAGARDERHRQRLMGLFARTVLIQTESADFDAAADLYRRCRRGGETVRNLIDCLIAAIAIRANLPILHSDADFAALSRHTPLQVYNPEGALEV